MPKTPKGLILYTHPHVSVAKPNFTVYGKDECHSGRCVSKKQLKIVFARKAMRHNESNGSADELMLELISSGNDALHSAGFPVKREMTACCEMGRSLVEMLGVLAIIGVLSVAGIAAFNSAMNKHRANELINEAQKRAVMVAMQATQGREELSVSEFTQPSGYIMGVQNWGEKQFVITLVKGDEAPIDSLLCSQIKNSVGENTPIRQVSSDCTRIIYNNDLSLTMDVDYTPGYNRPGCKKNSECIGEIVSGQTCSHNNCFCSFDCLQNSASTGGTCTLLDDGVEIPAEDIHLGPVVLKKKSFLKSDVRQDYDAARSWCKAHGRELISLSTLGLGPVTTSNHACVRTNCLDINGNPVPSDYWAKVSAFIGQTAWVLDKVAYWASFELRTNDVNYASHCYELTVICK